jgi:hypothetical protein
MITAIDRKVGKPKLSLRRPTKVLPTKMHGIIPAVISILKDWNKYSPEMLIAHFNGMIHAKESWRVLTKKEQAQLRAYLKAHEIEDYTKETHEKESDSASPASSRHNRRRR